MERMSGLILWRCGNSPARLVAHLPACHGQLVAAYNHRTAPRPFAYLQPNSRPRLSPTSGQHQIHGAHRLSRLSPVVHAKDSRCRAAGASAPGYMTVCWDREAHRESYSERCPSWMIRRCLRLTRCCCAGTVRHAERTRCCGTVRPAGRMRLRCTRTVRWCCPDRP